MYAVCAEDYGSCVGGSVCTDGLHAVVFVNDVGELFPDQNPAVVLVQCVVEELDELRAVVAV